MTHGRGTTTVKTAKLGLSGSPGVFPWPAGIRPCRLSPEAVAYQLEAIHEALRSEIGSEIDAVILRDLATEPTLSARRLAERLQLSQRAVEKHLAALQKKGRLLRHGSPRAGSWQVL